MKKLATILFVAILLVGCSTTNPERQAITVVGTTTTLVDGSMQMYGDLLSAGKIDTETEVKVKEAYQTYYLAITQLRKAVLVYRAAAEPDANELEIAIQATQAAADILLAILKELEDE